FNMRFKKHILFTFINEYQQWYLSLPILNSKEFMNFEDLLLLLLLLLLLFLCFFAWCTMHTLNVNTYTLNVHACFTNYKIDTVLKLV
ncbi:hypothetical protein ACMBCM_05840, partial [Spiroplasma sp. K1]